MFPIWRRNSVANPWRLKSLSLLAFIFKNHFDFFSLRLVLVQARFSLSSWFAILKISRFFPVSKSTLLCHLNWTISIRCVNFSAKGWSVVFSTRKMLRLYIGHDTVYVGLELLNFFFDIRLCRFLLLYESSCLSMLFVLKDSVGLGTYDLFRWLSCQEIVLCRNHFQLRGILAFRFIFFIKRFTFVLKFIHCFFGKWDIDFVKGNLLLARAFLVFNKLIYSLSRSIWAGLIFINSFSHLLRDSTRLLKFRIFFYYCDNLFLSHIFFIDYNLLD